MRRYTAVRSYDHDAEYVGLLQRVVETMRLGARLAASTFDFGAALPGPVDVVFVGALIHWVYCRTASFEARMDLVADYLFQYVARYLVIEWVDPADLSVRGFATRDGFPARCRENISDPTRGYTLASFQHNLRRHGEIIEAFDHRRGEWIKADALEADRPAPTRSKSGTRVIYVVRKRP